MNYIGNRAFGHVWVADFEYGQDANGLHDIRCMVARDLVSGERVRLWADELAALDRAPFGNEADELVVAFYAAAEMGCFRALGWPAPANVLDLYAEFRCLTNGLKLPAGEGLLGALVFFGLDAMAGAEKEEMRQLAIRGGDYITEERNALLDYCERDVDATAKLFSVMAARIDGDRSLVRGRYAESVARMEAIGVPVDKELIAGFYAERDAIRALLVEKLDTIGVFEDGSFRIARLREWVEQSGITDWPKTPTGQNKADEDTLKEMALRFPALESLRQLMATLAQLRAGELFVGADGRNRAMLSPFRSKTGRNQPSTATFIFGAPHWMRRFIRPPDGAALAYIDWEQQEFGIAAALSGDSAMLAAYESDDPYLAFAKMAGAVPAGATKKTHQTEREMYKTAALAVLYGMRFRGLSRRLGVSVAQAKHLLEQHRSVFPRYWEWSERMLDYGRLTGSLHTTFGWMIHVTRETRTTTLQNWPMQANGAEMLRIACILAHQRDVPVCAPVHDAVLVEASVDSIESAVTAMRGAMDRASRIVLDGFTLRTDVQIVRHPDRWPIAKGRAVWDIVAAHLVVEP